MGAGELFGSNLGDAAACFVLDRGVGSVGYVSAFSPSSEHITDTISRQSIEIKSYKMLI